MPGAGIRQGENGNEEQGKRIFFLQAIEKIIEDGYRKSREVETAEQSIAESKV